MYDHIGIKVGNLYASVRFYTAALAPLGYVLCSKDENGAGFGPKGEPALWLYLHKGLNGTGTHIAFHAPDHAAIKNFHAAGMKAGGRDNAENRGTLWAMLNRYAFFRNQVPGWGSFGANMIRSGATPRAAASRVRLARAQRLSSNSHSTLPGTARRSRIQMSKKSGVSL